nr:hypothetical protein BCU55_06005 [Shewanella sp. 10N.286.48.A6]
MWLVVFLVSLVSSWMVFNIYQLNPELLNHIPYDVDLIVTTYSVPLTTLSLIVPLVGLIALNHRSEQTNQQIKTSLKQTQMTLEQNLFTNYFKHKEEFHHFCEKLENDYPGYKSYTQLWMYDHIFPNSRNGDYKPVTLKAIGAKKPLNDFMTTIRNHKMTGVTAPELREQLDVIKSIFNSVMPISEDMIDVRFEKDQSFTRFRAIELISYVHKLVQKFCILGSFEERHKDVFGFELMERLYDITQFQLASGREKEQEEFVLLIEDVTTLLEFN